jgi:alpha-N-acetylglucosamine transferase
MTGVEGITQSHLFVDCANKLALSWIRHVPSSKRMQYDMVLLVTDPYGLLHAKARTSLQKVGWILIRVDPLYGIPSATSYVLQNRYTHTAQFTKLRLWAFEQYKNILYLDLDMLIMRDIVHVISAYNNTSVDTLAAARNADGRDYFNAGLLYITPSKPEFNRMVQAALHMNYDTELQEQAFLNIYWQNRTMFMPKELNESVDKHPTDKILVLHFCGNNKPWAVCSKKKSTHTQFKAACDVWNSYRSTTE